ncbi:MAG: hypothetical protein DRI87_10105, partial [Bacteroidetes bacterium]
MYHKLYSSKEIAEIINADIYPGDAPDLSVKDILVDSRRLITPDECMFFALDTPRNSGHKYIRDLYKKGVRLFVVSRFDEDYDKLP